MQALKQILLNKFLLISGICNIIYFLFYLIINTQAQNQQNHGTTSQNEPPHKLSSTEKASDESTQTNLANNFDPLMLNGEEINILQNLHQQKHDYLIKKKELDTAYEKLNLIKQNINRAHQQLQEVNSQINAKINKLDNIKREHLQNMVKIYESMKPEKVAKIFENLDLNLLKTLFMALQPKKAAAILLHLKSEHAAELMNLIGKEAEIKPVTAENLPTQDLPEERQ